MHEMQTIVTDVHGISLSVCPSVCLCVCLLCRACNVCGVIQCSFCQITLASCYFSVSFVECFTPTVNKCCNMRKLLIGYSTLHV